MVVLLVAASLLQLRTASGLGLDVVTPHAVKSAASSSAHPASTTAPFSATARGGKSNYTNATDDETSDKTSRDDEPPTERSPAELLAYTLLSNQSRPPSFPNEDDKSATTSLFPQHSNTVALRCEKWHIIRLWEILAFLLSSKLKSS